ncbi:MAG: hypothetical protein RL213_1076 [Bacteroidota bacterium]|jgi:hypothetical protein
MGWCRRRLHERYSEDRKELRSGKDDIVTFFTGRRNVQTRRYDFGQCADFPPMIFWDQNLAMRNLSLIRFFVVSLFLMNSVIASAQLRYGVMAGVNVSTVYGDGSNDNADRIGIHAGLTGEWSINEKFGVSPSVLYSMKGATDAHDDQIGLTLNYLEVPLIVTYEVFKGFRAGAGAYAAFLLKSEAKDHYLKMDLIDSFRAYDSGVAFRLEYRFSKSFGVYGTYSHGLVNINDDGAFNGTENFNASGSIGGYYTIGK